DEIFLFSEPANLPVAPGGTLYRSDAFPARFSMFSDYFGNRVPTGVYSMALWVDPNNTLAESNEINNASLVWSTINITNGLAARSSAGGPATPSSVQSSAISAQEAYNGKILPGQGAARKVRISATPHGGRQIELLDQGGGTDSGPLLKTSQPQTWSKVAHARQQVIFPVAEKKPMPISN